MESDGSVEVALFVHVGIAPKTAKELIRNKSHASRLYQLLAAEVSCPTKIQAKFTLESKVDKKIGTLFYNIAVSAISDNHFGMLASYVLDGKLDSVRWDYAKPFLEKVGAGAVDVAVFEVECGIGKTVSEAELSASIAHHFKELAVVEEGWETLPLKLTKLLNHVRADVRFVEGRDVKTAVDKEVERLLGPKPAPTGKPKPKKEVKPKEEEVKEPAREFPDPRDNKDNRPELLEAHLARTGGRVYTRFPPEPNGYLHIGHAKAMSLDFGYAKARGGVTYMRFDDTNPEKEKQVYIDSILETLEWLGHKPWKTTYSSDYFQELYDFGVGLIKKDKAYVCHETAAQMKEGRMNRRESPWRNRPIAESLQLFDDMRRGKVAEGAATLRVKADMKSDNPNMRDFVAFRVKFNPHPHAGDKWCVYPSYDFTHCIVDSLEDITHSLCTLEFESRRQSYFWLLDECNLYKPVVWEFARLEFEGALLSKRKIKRLVEEGLVDGWDDPRLLTLVGLRRRGYTPAAIQSLCDAIGVTRVKSVHPMSLLEHHLRLDLDMTAERKFVVIDPVRVRLTNLPGPVVCTAPRNPRAPELGTREMVLTSTLYIERSDFRVEDEPGYYGLAPGKYVNLKYAGFIRATNYKVVAGKVTEIEATYEETFNGPEKAVKGHLHWVAHGVDGRAPQQVEVRVYSALLPPVPSDAADWIADVNKQSKEVLVGCVAEAGLTAVQPFDHFQFERIGYFSVDPDSTPQHLVFNKSVSLNQAKDKK